MKTKLSGFLDYFFKSRITQEELIQRHILVNEVHTDGFHLNPLIIQKVTQYIEKHGSDVEGIYRVSGMSLDVRKMSKLFYLEDFDMEEYERETSKNQINIHVVTGALKLYLRELTAPLIPFRLYDSFMRTQTAKDPQVQLSLLKAAIWNLPEMNKWALEILMRHLMAISKNSEENKMTTANLGIVIGPSLMRPKTESLSLAMVSDNEKKCGIVQMCVEKLEDLFSPDEPEPEETESEDVVLEEPVMRHSKTSKDHAPVPLTRSRSHGMATKSATRVSAEAMTHFLENASTRPVVQNLTAGIGRPGLSDMIVRLSKELHTSLENG